MVFREWIFNESLYGQGLRNPCLTRMTVEGGLGYLSQYLKDNARHRSFISCVLPWAKLEVTEEHGSSHNMRNILAINTAWVLL